MLTGLLAKLGLNLLFGRIKRVVSAVPWQIWAAIAVVILIVLASWWHSGKVSDALAAARKEGQEASDAAWQKRFDDMRDAAEQWRQQAQTAQNRISEEEQKRHEAESRAIASRADALRVRGPGQAASCPGPVNHPGVPAGAGQPESPSGSGDAAGAGVPPANRRADVPWEWLVERAEQCDVNRAEVESWRRWYDEQSRLNQELRLRGRVQQ